ncbi:MAG: alpha/beta fold hydrolase [Nevskia sp.]|nr:alpha/beta fold hydrolase [Nevskia sp.]
MSVAPAAEDAGFHPSWVVANPQVQSILATKGPRRRLWLKRGSRMDAVAQKHVLDCGDDVRLVGYHSHQPESMAPRGLLVLIHGWEGHHDSAYVYSMACQAYALGWNIFRLNLRDHGGTHALNAEPFHSARMGEVLGAIRAVQQFDAALPLAVIGFSLGGNFALRVGMQGPAAGVMPRLSIGISPAIDPGATLHAIDQGPLLFRRYFIGKWRKTLRAKDQAWPGRYDFGPYAGIKTFVETTRRFVSDFTDFPSSEDYLGTYTLTPAMLMASASPLAIITAQDDPVIPFRDFAGLEARGSVIQYDAPQHGGHCGFIDNLGLECWAERRVMDLLEGLS